MTAKSKKNSRLWVARSSKAKKEQARKENGQYWVKYETAEDLLAACYEYFEWVENNPLQQDNLFAYQGTVTHEPMLKMRAMSFSGLCIFLGISGDCLNNYRHGRPDPAMKAVVAMVDDTLRTQKFEGAAAGLLNPNIIARDLGLVERQELTGKDGKPIEVENQISPSTKLMELLNGIAKRSGAAGDSDS